MRQEPVVGAVAVLFLLSGCATATGDHVVDPPEHVSASEAHESELGPGWDEEPDGEPASPDQDLTSEELNDLLRLAAPAASAPDSCGPGDVELGLAFSDAATGHRFGQVWVRNSSDSECSVDGFPGFGARGEYGSKFLLEIEHVEPGGMTSPDGVVSLAPGEQAFANVEWSGELAGAASEPISLFVLQLASDQDALGHPVTGSYSQNAEPGGSEPGALDVGIDIGMQTTVRLGAFQSGTRASG